MESWARGRMGSRALWAPQTLNLHSNECALRVWSETNVFFFFFFFFLIIFLRI